MTEDSNEDDRYVVTDHERIRRLADVEDLEPIAIVPKDEFGDVRIRSESDDLDVDGRTDPDAERITWDEFFDWFEGSGRVVQYRPGRTGGGVLEIVDRSTTSGGPDATSTGSASTENPPDTDTEPLATGDTGDAEPVAFERRESERTEPDDADDASTAPTADAERAPSSIAEGLVLDEIHEAQAGLDTQEGSDEFIAFRNKGDTSIDLSGWTVENEVGRSYQFPQGTVLNPGRRVRLYSGHGEDTEDRLHWGASGSLWDDDITVVVRNEAGERVLRERYET